MFRQFRTNRRAFTLVELLVVTAIIAVLVGLVLTAIQTARIEAARAQSRNNLRNIGTATQQYNDVKNALPIAVGWSGASGEPKDLESDGSAFFHILPYLGQQALYESTLDWIGGMFGEWDGPAWYWEVYYPYYGYSSNIHMGVFAYYATNLDSKVPVKILIAQADPTHSGSDNFISYVANRDAMDGKRSVSTIVDGSTSTMLYAEAYSSCYGTYSSPYFNRETSLSAMTDTYPDYKIYGYKGPTFGRDEGYHQHNPQTGQYTWKAPSDTFQNRPSVRNCNPRMPQSLASSSILVGMADGSVRSVASGVSFSSWSAAITPESGEVIDSDF
jgi:prepilin-type N-terminal cleavage/methylation domain-containing protein